MLHGIEAAEPRAYRAGGMAVGAPSEAGKGLLDETIIIDDDIAMSETIT